MDASDRRRHLFLVVDNLLEKQAEWIESPGTVLEEASEFWLAIDDAVEVFSQGDIPADCRLLDRAMTALAPVWNEFAAGRAANPSMFRVPSERLWRLLKEIEKCREAATPKRGFALETIQEMLDQRLGYAQMARMHGWYEVDGSPQIWKVKEEIAQPGKWRGPDFIPPLQLAAERRDRELRERLDRLESERAAKVARASKAAPESIEALIVQGLSLRQICDMKRCQPAAVFEAADNAGLQRPPYSYPDVRTARAPAEPDINEATNRALDAEAQRPTRPRVQEGADGTPVIDGNTPPTTPKRRGRPPKVQPAPPPAPKAQPTASAEDDEPAAIGVDEMLEQEIAFYASQGMDEAAIASAVRQPGRSVDPQMIRETLSRYEEDPSQFDLVV